MYSHNLESVYMEYDYTHLNHNLLVSQKKVVTKGVIIKGGLLCIIHLLCVVQLEGTLRQQILSSTDWKAF
jgi:hypothetical protein